MWQFEDSRCRNMKWSHWGVENWFFILPTVHAALSLLPKQLIDPSAHGAARVSPPSPPVDSTWSSNTLRRSTSESFNVLRHRHRHEVGLWDSQKRPCLCFVKKKKKRISTDSRRTLWRIQSSPFKVCRISHGLLQLISSTASSGRSRTRRMCLISCRFIVTPVFIYPSHLSPALPLFSTSWLVRFKSTRRWIEDGWCGLDSEGAMRTLAVLCSLPATKMSPKKKPKKQGSHDTICHSTSKTLLSPRLRYWKTSREREKLLSASSPLEQGLGRRKKVDLIWHQIM